MAAAGGTQGELAQACPWLNSPEAFHNADNSPDSSTAWEGLWEDIAPGWSSVLVANQCPSLRPPQPGWPH